MSHTLIGYLANGEAIYVDGEDNILIEKDHKYLVAANVGEWIEANRIWSKKKRAEASLPNGVTAKPSCGRLDRKTKGQPVKAR